MRPMDGYDPDGMRFAPFVLLPSTFPKSEFDRAVQLQPVINELFHKVAHSYEFLLESLKRFVLFCTKFITEVIPF